MFDFKIFFHTFFSPSLYMLQRTVWEKYSPNEWEKIGDNLVNIILVFYKIGVYSSPILATYMYRRGYMTPETLLTLSKVSLGIGVIMGSSYCIRSYGRASNDKYKTFLSRLNMSSSKGKDGLNEIKRYDFDFNYWPIEYEYKEGLRQKPSETKGWRSSLSSLIYSPCSLLGYFVLHTFGIRMIYPGSTTILNFILSAALMDGRKVLIENKRGERFKLKTVDGNFIDTMFVDKRSLGGEKANVLVVCSEGNAGFYESGIMLTAVDAGYSVLGWNHPGFGCSTGMPYPDQEQNAIDTVMQFSIMGLGFSPENIILYGWSIGGYSVSWAAMHYPRVKGVILDATFDDILPLALNQMPEFLESLVRLTIRSYADLNVSRLLVEYPGPIKLIRRTEDEVICIIPGEISTNRGNFLLKKLLKRRYPALFTENSEHALQDWFETSGSSKEKVANDEPKMALIQTGNYSISSHIMPLLSLLLNAIPLFIDQFKSQKREDTSVLENYEVDENICQGLLADYRTSHGDEYPYTLLGKESPEELKIALLLYLAGKYMEDFSSTHCTPLPSRIFSNLTNF